MEAPTPPAGLRVAALIRLSRPAAARLENVRARMADPGTRDSSTRWATRRTRNSVLPAPGPATTSWGPSVVEMASGQSGGSRRRSSSFESPADLVKPLSLRCSGRARPAPALVPGLGPVPGQAARGGSVIWQVGPSTTVNPIPTSSKALSAAAKASASMVGSSLSYFIMLFKLSGECDTRHGQVRDAPDDGVRRRIRRARRMSNEHDVRQERRFSSIGSRQGPRRYPADTATWTVISGSRPGRRCGSLRAGRDQNTSTTGVPIR